jgi:hypothetical protein
MPAPGEKDAQGYVWNGIGWVDPKTGFLKRSQDDVRQKNSGFANAIGALTSASTWKQLGDARTWIDPTRGDTRGGLGWIKLGNDILNPTTSFGKSVQNAQQGDWAKAAGWGLLGAASVYGGAQGLGGALTAAGRTVKPLSAGAKTFTNLAGAMEGTTGLRRGAALWKGINPTKAGKAFSAVGATGALASILQGPNAGSKPTASSVLPGRASTAGSPAMTAAQYEAMAAANANRTDAAGNSGMGGRALVAPAAGGAGTSGAGTGAAGAGKVGLLPLTPEQIASTGQDLTAIEKAYQDALNQYLLQEKQGNIDYTQTVQGARRQAAGSAQDVASQLSAAGLDISPAAAFGAGQIVEAPRQAQETAARTGLDQLLASIKAGKTQAATQRDTNKLMINRLIDQYRIANTLASQEAAYRAMGGI